LELTKPVWLGSAESLRLVPLWEKAERRRHAIAILAINSVDSDLQALQHEHLDPLITAHDRHIVMTATTDGVLADFAIVDSALRCALDIQRRIVEYNTKVSANDRVAVRMGSIWEKGPSTARTRRQRLSRWRRMSAIWPRRAPS
jgi:hypothetical protein